MGPPRTARLTEREEEVKEEYMKTLVDLHVNSKPLIDVLTEVAAENKEYAACIVECIEKQLERVADGPLQLPVLYLIDSIIKCETIKQYYLPLFHKRIHILFMKVYLHGDETIRNKLAKLRFTWNGVLPAESLAALDCAVRKINPSWQVPPPPAVHVNPKFISAGVAAANAVKTSPGPTKEELRRKRKELFELTQRKQELEEELKVLRPAQMKSKLGDRVAGIPVTTNATEEALSTFLSRYPNPVPNTRPNLATARTWTKSTPNQFVLNRANGSLLPQQPAPNVRIAPVCSALIEAAAKRGRDPRLQKTSNTPVPKKLPPTSEAASSVNGRRETTAPTCRTVQPNASPVQSVVAAAAAASMKTESSAKSKSVATKNSSPTAAAEEPSPKKRKIENTQKSESPPQRASNCAKKEETRKRKALSEKSDNKCESDTPSPEKRKSNGDSAAKSKSSPAKKRSSVSATIDELFEDSPPSKKDEKHVTKTYSKEERAKRLRILMKTPPQETERLLETLTKESPKMAEKLIKLLNKEKETLKTSPVVDVDADASPKSETRSPPPPKTEPEPEPEESDSVDVDADADVDCVIVSSPTPVLEKMKSPPRSESLDEYDPIADLPEPEESHSPIAEPKVESPQRTPPATQDVDLRTLMGLLPPVSAPVLMPPSTRQSPPNAPPPPPPLFPFMVPGMDFAFPGMLQPSTVEVPNANVDVLRMIARDPMSTINIDNVPREIRHYGMTSVVFLNWDDPRQILFSSDNMPRKIIIDGKFVFECYLNSPDIERTIFGHMHKFRLGAPTRELSIDGIGYECYFNGPPTTVWMNGRNHSVRLEGRPPKVDIGHKRTDLVAGKITIVINDMHTFSLFLDAKAQKIEVEGCKFVILFIDSLQRILINDVPFRTDFGGINHPFKHYNKLFYFRLTTLPMGVIPGAVNIYQMIASKLPSPPPLPPSLRVDEFPLMPVPPMMSNVPMIPVTSIPAPIMMSGMQTSMAPVPDPYPTGVNEPSTSVPAVREEETAKESLSIDELVQKLLAEGLVSLPEVTSTSTEKEPSPPRSSTTRSKKSRKEAHAPKDEPVKHVDLNRPETLKQKQPGMVALLFNGNQCSSCGLRFSGDQTQKYSAHLDWHFRSNRRGKDGARTIHSRKWYYNAETWLQFTEIEDESDRGQSWFDNHPATEYTEEVVEEVPCVRASADVPEECELCCDKFEQFYNQELDEWQLRNAVNVEGKIYHPICIKDHKPIDDDVQLIVEECEPISLTEDEPSNVTDDNVISVDDLEFPDVSFIKKEKVDTPAVADDRENRDAQKEEPARESEDKPADEDDDSDIEEVQLIEEPIEEIIIQDDEKDDDEDGNLETLHIEGMVESPTDPINENAVNPPIENPMDKIVDITQNVSTVSIDGNVEPGDSLPIVPRAQTIIKFNITKNHGEDKSNSPRRTQSSPKSDENEKSDKVHDFGGLNRVNEEPPPPGEEPMVTLVAADVKPRIRERKPTEYPPVKRGDGDSGLCSIM